MPEYSVVGKRHPRVDAVDKVTGKALYAADISLPNTLHGKVLRSPYARANIRRLDTSRAEALDGVLAVITAADVPGKKDEEERPSPMVSCLAGKRIIFAGQPLAAVAAITPEIAEEAMGLIEVEYEELTPVTDILKAMEPDSPLVHPNTYTRNLPEKDAKPSNVFWYMKNERGDVEAGFKEADVIQENTFRTQAIDHAYLEPRAATASVSPDGKVTVWCDNQGIFEARHLIADFLGLPLNHVKVVPTEVGGAFGGKSHQVLPPLCALLSQKTGRPVKIVMSREEVFKANRPIPASAITVKTGATREGRLTATSVTMVYDYGALHGMGGMPPAPMGTFTSITPYRIPNLQIESHSVFTNKVPSGPFRGPTAPQAAFAMESQMDLMARELGIDPLDFRLKNAVAKGDPMISGATFVEIGLRQVIESMQQHLAKKEKPAGENRGRGVACGFWFGGAGAGGAHVNVNADGTVELVIGALDVSGSRTSLAQVAAEELGIPFEQVSVVTGDTETAPFSIPSVGSQIARALTPPICRACQDVKAQARAQAAPMLQVDLDDTEYVGGRVQVKGIPEKSVSLAEISKGITHFPAQTPITGRGVGRGFQQSLVFAAAAADVEVDKETGKVKVLSYAVAQDAGCAINPTVVEGQMQGASAQGIGWALSENRIFNNGVMQNANLLDYRMPTAADMPFVDTLLVEVPLGAAPYGIRGVGEPPLVPSLAAIANAVHSATGVRLKELPMTPEAVLSALQAQVTLE